MRFALTALVLLSSLVASTQAVAGTATPGGRAADCRFADSKSYGEFGAIQLFTTQSGLYGCVTDVGTAYRLDARTTKSSRTVFGKGDWIALPTRDGNVRAVNLKTGRSHRTRARATVTALVVNFDGTVSWIAAGVLRTKAVKSGVRRLGTGADREFLGLELDGCAVTWKVDGAQRSSSVHCRAP